MSPFEYHNDKLGFKISFIVSDRCSHELSLTLMSYDALVKRRIRGKNKGEFIELRRGCLNNAEPLVTWDSVPQYIKDLVVERFGHPKEASKISLLEQAYIRDAKAFDFYSSYKKSNGEFLTDKFIQEYTANASALNAIHAVLTDRIGLKKALGGKTTGIHADMVRVIANYKDKWCNTLPNSDRLIRNYYKPYIKHGYAALISGKIDNDNSRKVDSFIVKFLNTLFAGQQHKPTMSEVAGQYSAFLGGYIEDIINTTTGECYDPKDKRFKPLSKSTITNYLREWENKIGTWSKRGDHHRDVIRFITPHKFNRTVYAGSIISVDDRQPPFYYNTDKDRQWWYIGQDLGSGAWTCWVHGTSKKGLILDFYRQMVRNYAEWGVSLPHELEGEMSLNSSFQNTFLQDGSMFSRVKLAANAARQKYVEREIGVLRNDYERELEGWVARPFARSENNQAPDVDYAGGMKIIPYDTITANELEMFQTLNNMPHKVKTNMTRWEYFMAMQNPELRPTNYRGFLRHIGYRTQTSCNVGVIKLNNTTCLLGDNGKVAAGPYLINFMKQVEGEKVDIYWLDDNDGGILKALIYIGDQYICEAVPQPTYARAIIERTPEDSDAMDAMSKYVSTITGFMKQQRNTIDKVMIIGQPTKVLNNGFKIRGLAAPITEEVDAEILPEVNDDFELVPVQTDFKQHLKDRW